MLALNIVAAIVFLIVGGWGYFRFFWRISLEGVIPIPH